MSSRQVSLLQRAVRRGGLWVALAVAVEAMAGCGDGGGTATSTAAAVSPTAQTITQSDIVLPSSVQVVTAK